MRENLRHLLKLFFNIQVVFLLLLFFLLGLFLGRFIWLGPAVLPSNDQRITEASPSPSLLTLGEVKQQKADGKAVTLPQTYVVQPGDSTWRIAEAFYDDPMKYPEIEKANQLPADQGLEVGQELTIPKLSDEEQVLAPVVKPLDQEQKLIEAESANEPYLVQPNDSLWFIALKYLDDGERWEEIYQQNRPMIGEDPNLIYPGQTLVLPKE